MDEITITRKTLALQKLYERAIRIKNLSKLNMYDDLLTYLNTCKRLYGEHYLFELQDKLREMNYSCTELDNMVTCINDEN